MRLEDFVALIQTKAGTAVDPGEIETFEALIGTKLPPDYRRLLTMTRGGPLASTVIFPLGAGDHREFLKSVGGLSDDAYYSLAANHADNDLGLPEHLLWIMGDRGGNPIAICLRPDRLGEVFFIDHELVSPEDEPMSIEEAEDDDLGLAIKVAPSFGAFLALLAVET